MVKHANYDFLVFQLKLLLDKRRIPAQVLQELIDDNNYINEGSGGPIVLGEVNLDGTDFEVLSILAPREQTVEGYQMVRRSVLWQVQATTADRQILVNCQDDIPVKFHNKTFVFISEEHLSERGWIIIVYRTEKGVWIDRYHYVRQTWDDKFVFLRRKQLAD